MTINEIAEHVAAYLQHVLKEYTISNDVEWKPVDVFAGWPPIRREDRKNSFIYVCITNWTDDLEGTPWSKATVQIGFSVHGSDLKDGWRDLYNLMEHVRQALLTCRTIAGRARLESPLKGMIVADNPTFPEWTGAITAVYSIAQPQEVSSWQLKK